jgi:hypothetical protein
LLRQLEEQIAAAAAQDVTSLVEIARMLEQIAKLERYSLSKTLGAFRDKIKSVVKGAVL